MIAEVDEDSEDDEEAKSRRFTEVGAQLRPKPTAVAINPKRDFSK
jgi:hypothetical protein